VGPATSFDENTYGNPNRVFTKAGVEPEGGFKPGRNEESTGSQTDYGRGTSGTASAERPGP
jgi:hypothetical protein